MKFFRLPLFTFFLLFKKEKLTLICFFSPLVLKSEHTKSTITCIEIPLSYMPEVLITFTKNRKPFNLTFLPARLPHFNARQQFTCIWCFSVLCSTVNRFLTCEKPNRVNRIIGDSCLYSLVWLLPINVQCTSMFTNDHWNLLSVTQWLSKYAKVQFLVSTLIHFSPHKYPVQLKANQYLQQFCYSLKILSYTK